MADEKPVEPATPANPPPDAGVVPQVAAVPPVPAAPAEALAPAAVVEPAAPAAPVVEPLPTAAPTLLEKFDKNAKEKPAEPAKDAAAEKPAEPAKPAEAKPAEKPVEAVKPAEAKPGDPVKVAEPAKPEPVEYKYTLPETLKIDDARKDELHAAFDAFRANPAEGAQPLIDLHNKTMQDYAAHLEREQHRIFAETRANWAKEVLADEQIGGSGHQTAMGAIARMRDLFVPEKDRPAFEEMLRVTGAGDNPAFLRAFHNAARFFDEPPMPPANARPSPNNGAGPARLRDVYTHPRSSTGRA